MRVQRFLGIVVACLFFFPNITLAQVAGSVVGTVQDISGAVIPGAAVTVKNLETGAARIVTADDRGYYRALSLPVGRYEIAAEKTGFQRQVKTGIDLVVGQEAVLNWSLAVGEVQQTVTVTAAASMVNTTLSSTSGLVGEKEIKDLPLNGRSFDQLLTLNVGTVNYTSNTNAGRGNFFTVAGKRPEENRFLLNGVDYIGTDNTATVNNPIGASRQLLGVDAVREFNVVQHSYGAEYGKRAGGQVSIVTSSGTNQLHGDAFEYLRNSKLDARNFFDQQIGPFKRNQFGGALGGPLKKDKLFLFGNYEGFRQRLGISNVAVVPDALARQGFLPIGPNNSEIQVPNLKTGMLPFFAFWPVPNGRELGGGLALDFSNPPQAIREDFGLTRFDYNVSGKDSFSVNYLIDDGENDNPQADRNFFSPTPQRSQVLGFQETRIFSPTVLNVATVGFSRARTVSGIIPAVPIPANLAFITGLGLGTITIGGGTSVQSGGSVTPASGQWTTGNSRNNFTWADDVHFMTGKHSLTAGLWIQRVRENVGGNNTTAGSISYPSLLAFLQDLPTQFQGFPNPTPLGFRSTETAWYVQDEIKLKPNLTLRLGLRDEMTTGWNEASGRCSNYLYDANWVVETDPLIGASCFTQNNAIALWQPRVGLAWDPTGTGTWAVRAGFGIHNDLQDNMGLRMSADPPFNARTALTTPLLSWYPLPGGTQPPPNCNAQLQAAKQPCSILAPAGMEPNFHTPTIQQWSFTLEREITKDLMLQLGYVGSQTYHLPMTLNMNAARPQVCADPAGCTSGGFRAANQTGHVPQGTTYMPSTPGVRPNPFVANTSQTWWFLNNSSYEGGSISLVKRASHGLTFKTNYTFSKGLDLASAISNPLGGNDPGHPAWNRYDLKLSKGVAAFNTRHQFNANFSYELPFARGQRAASGFRDKLIGGWQWNGILTAQGGFPFTPQAGSNISGTGASENPDPPSRNPGFSGPVILGKVNQWYDPKAFVLPIAGTFGNVARGSFIGPGLTTFDTSLFKKFSINERWNLQFRAEVFNLLNHANFGTPNQIVFSGANISPSAGLITGTATSSRQLQFALKLLW